MRVASARVPCVKLKGFSYLYIYPRQFVSEGNTANPTVVIGITHTLPLICIYSVYTRAGSTEAGNLPSRPWRFPHADDIRYHDKCLRRHGRIQGV